MDKMKPAAVPRGPRRRICVLRKTVSVCHRHDSGGASQRCKLQLSTACRYCSQTQLLVLANSGRMRRHKKPWLTMPLILSVQTSRWCMWKSTWTELYRVARQEEMALLLCQAISMLPVNVSDTQARKRVPFLLHLIITKQ